jgi:hypothetical protein
MENLNQNPVTPVENKTPEGGAIRPWQGTLLGVLNIIGLVALALAIVLAFVGGSMLVSLLPVWGMLGGIGMALGFILIAIWILVFFITKGIFKGQRWAIIVSLIFTGIALLSSIMNISEMFFSLLIYAGMLYLEVVCLKDPYYNK